jgi:type IV pilus assembly protein PilO
MNEKLKLAGILVGLGIFYGFYELYDFYSTDQAKMRIEANNAKQSLNVKKEELAKLKVFAEGISETKVRLKKINAEFEEALEFIPRNIDPSQLMARLSSLARNSGIEVISFKPLKEEGVSSEPSKPVEAGKEAGAAARAPFYQTVKLEIQLHGGFAQTVAFFDQVSRLKRILNVETLKMQTKSIEGDRTPSNVSTVLDSTVLVKTYRFVE